MLEQCQGRTDTEWGLFIHFYTQGTRREIEVLRVLCLLDGAGILSGQKSKANISSLWGRRGDRLHGSINSYNMGEGRMRRVWFFHSCIPKCRNKRCSSCSKNLLGLICSFILGSPHAPFDTLLISNHLLISLLRHLGTQSQRKGGDDRSDFFRLNWGTVGLWVPFACSLSGCIYRGR